MRLSAVRCSFLLQRRRGAGPRAHHVDVRAVLVELDLVALTAGMARHERKEPEIAIGVALDEVIPLEVKRREVAVVVLHSLSHQKCAVFRAERKRSCPLSSASFAFASYDPGAMETRRALTVGPTVQLHLDQTQVDPHLDLLGAVVTRDDADLKPIGLVFPAVQDALRCLGSSERSPGPGTALGVRTTRAAARR